MKITRFQWGQLLALTGVHFLIDVSGGVLPAVLPAVRQNFGLSLTQGVSLITVLYFCCNLFQVFLGHLRAGQRSTFFLPLGMLLATFIYLIGFVPNFSLSYVLLLLIAVVTGFGVAVVHPESLRALHLLRRIPSALGTAVFLNAGFLGFTAGGLIGASLVQWLGLKGLILFVIPFALCVFFILKSRLRLATEKKRILQTESSYEKVNFWLLFAIAVPIATGSTVIPALLPTALHELGYELYFGGLPALMLGIGGIAGSLFWASFAKRFGQFIACSVSAVIAGPFVIIYMLLIKQPAAILLLTGAGFGAQGAFTLVVSLARNSPGFVLGQRMGLIVGGVWGLAALVLIVLGPVAEHFGVRAVLNYTPATYLLAGSLGFAALVFKKFRK